ncbi:MAG: hypothetical protein DDT22_00188 [candidate division WS2 bacterium]|nr:hypothetical protein [Candidatus Lithacetigena glycinireducens]
MDRIFLHTCCVGCAAGVIDTLINKFKVKPFLFFYNPNIQPEDEYLKRKEALTSLTEITQLSIEIPNYNPEEHLSYINSPEKINDRCFHCYYLRLSYSIEKARLDGFFLFSTTLLASPHQNHEKIKEICQTLTTKQGIDFIYYDFRKTYYKHLGQVKKTGLYCQKYCGCLYSMNEKVNDI